MSVREFHQSFAEVCQNIFTAVTSTQIVNKLASQFDEQIKQIPKGKFVVGFVSIRKVKDYQNVTIVTEGNLFLKSYDTKDQSEFWAKKQDSIHPDNTWSSSTFITGPNSYENPFKGGTFTWFCYFYGQ